MTYFKQTTFLIENKINISSNVTVFLYFLLLGVSCVGEHEFQCADGGCIHIDFRCDGTADCFDDSDEANCTCKLLVDLSEDDINNYDYSITVDRVTNYNYNYPVLSGMYIIIQCCIKCVINYSTYWCLVIHLSKSFPIMKNEYNYVDILENGGPN